MCDKRQRKHIRPGKDDWACVDADGYPTKPLKWDPRCPLASLEYIFSQQLDEDVPKRCYPAFNPKRKRSDAHLGSKNIGSPSKAAVEFMQVQGLPKFDTNSGRKALARWCKHLNVPYRLSVHIHGDLQRLCSNRETPMYR